MKEEPAFDSDYLIIGSGPAGDAAANRLAELGARNVVVVEQGPLGGTCVNWGCIPTHFLLENLLLRRQISEMNDRHRLFSAVPEVDFSALKSGKKKVIESLQLGITQSFEKGGIELIRGKARLVTPHQVEITQEDGSVVHKTAGTILVAAGAPFTRLDVPGMETVKEYLIRADRVLDLNFNGIPESIVVYGFDSPAVELASLFHLLGSEVALLSPHEAVISYGSPELAQTVEEMLEFYDVEVYTGVVLKEFESLKDRLQVRFLEKGENEIRIEGRFFINAFGRQPDLNSIENLPLELEGDRPAVSEHFQSSVKNIYFLGDVRSGGIVPFRSHLAAFSGKVLAERLMGKDGDSIVDLSLLLRGLVTIDFEVAKIGLTEQEAVNRGLEVQTIKTPHSYLAQAHILGQAGGYTLLVVEQKTGRLLGGEIVGPDAINLITIVGTAIACKATLQHLRKFPAFHPSMAEGIFESAWQA